jgi:hypothetical protein
LADAPLRSILRPRNLDRFFTLVKSFLPIEVSEPSGARFMDFHKDFGLVIACKIPNTPLNMNYNFGLRKVSMSKIIDEKLHLSKKTALQAKNLLENGRFLQKYKGEKIL